MPRTEAEVTVIHHLRVHRSDENLAREGQLAWHIAEVAADPVGVEPDVFDMIINRVIDNAAVAAASLTRAPVSRARLLGAPGSHAAGIGTVSTPAGSVTLASAWFALVDGSNSGARARKTARGARRRRFFAVFRGYRRRLGLLKSRLPGSAT
jgi:hypothetical protein